MIAERHERIALAIEWLHQVADRIEMGEIPQRFARSPDSPVSMTVLAVLGKLTSSEILALANAPSCNEEFAQNGRAHGAGRGRRRRRVGYRGEIAGDAFGRDVRVDRRPQGSEPLGEASR